MTESMIVEAVRAAVGVRGPDAAQALPAAQATADPQAVEAFERAMAVDGPTPVPFASQVAETWSAAQDNYQTILHRMTALAEMTRLGGASAAQLTELQYQVASLSFQQEIVTNIAKKASDAVSTLVKNG